MVLNQAEALLFYRQMKDAKDGGIWDPIQEVFVESDADFLARVKARLNLPSSPAPKPEEPGSSSPPGDAGIAPARPLK